MTIITRFAPSPTGYLHIGSARTALFNWLYAKHTNGLFYLRIENTDKARSTDEAVNAIISGMKWLGLEWDDDIVLQSNRQARHKEIALKLLEMGKAYHCYTSSEEIAEFRQNNPHSKFQSIWAEKNSGFPAYIKPCIRIRAQKTGVTTIHDHVRGESRVNNTELDDMVILRADGTPTYMLAVVVDDFDMKINHIIRGDDHFTNTFRQLQIIKALDWPIPEYTHIPLIHGMDGTKLSKRHGALGIDSYKQMGYLPEAINNHLLRLGWSHHDEEIISTSRAVEIFDLDGLNKSAAKFDIEKLNSINSHYISDKTGAQLLNLIEEQVKYSDHEKLILAIDNAKYRSHTLLELIENLKIFMEDKGDTDSKCSDILNKGGYEILNSIKADIQAIDNWNISNIEQNIEAFSIKSAIKKSIIMQSLRAGILGVYNSPSIIDVMIILGKEEVLKRIC